MEISPDRMAAQIEKPFVVFLFGIRINVFWKFHRWWPVVRAMRSVLKELRDRPEIGLLGYESWLGNPLLTVQYWRSFEDLLKYAGEKNFQHLPAWIAFKDRHSKGAAVGIWHEAYMVEPGGFETTYKNMPPFGLGRATHLSLYRGPYIRLHRVSRLSDGESAKDD